MEKILQYLASMGIDLQSLLITAGILIAGSILFGAIGRFIFGKKSTLVNAVSSAIGILFVYALNIVLRSAGAEFQHFSAPLPFVTFDGDSMFLFRFEGADYTLICTELVGMILLAFLMNMIDNFMPKGKNIFTWTFFRVLTVVLAQIAHLLVTWLTLNYLPEGIVTYAPAIVLGLLLIMLLTGALKIIVGVFLSTINPLIAALYTFFFANIVGKQVTKAVLTTAILTLMVFLLQYFGISSISIAMGALVAYVPFLIILLVMWNLVIKLF